MHPVLGSDLLFNWKEWRKGFTLASAMYIGCAITLAPIVIFIRFFTSSTLGLDLVTLKTGGTLAELPAQILGTSQSVMSFFVGVSAVPDVADHFDRDRRSTLARRARGVVQRQCVSGDDGGVDRANSSGVFSVALFAGLRADDRDFGWGRVGGDHDPVAARLGDRRHRSDDRSGRDVRLAGGGSIRLNCRLNKVIAGITSPAGSTVMRRDDVITDF